MEISNNEELRMLESTIDTCRTPVWLVTPNGQRYNLKDPMERYQGIGELIGGHGLADLEIYASSYDDEMRLFGFIADCKELLQVKTA